MTPQQLRDIEFAFSCIIETGGGAGDVTTPTGRCGANSSQGLVLVAEVKTLQKKVSVYESILAETDENVDIVFDLLRGLSYSSMYRTKALAVLKHFRDRYDSKH